MEFIFSKKQIDLLREDDESSDKLDVVVKPNDPKRDEKIKNALSQPNVDEINIPPSDKTNTTNPALKQPGITTNVEVETERGRDISPETLNKAMQAANNSGVGVQIDPQESVVRYSKKELNKFLFK